MEDLNRAEAQLGTLLKGKWRIEKILGVGGTATVFLAVHRNQKKVAVKMLHYELSSYPEVRDRFLREGYVANTLETDGVVEILDDDITEDGQAFLVMEVLEGETVDARWEKCGNKMPPLDALKWMDATLDVLHRAHQKGIIHRDIKPENLFITKEERLKVLDFGIARIFQGTDVQKQTQQGFVMGTPAFMAPEQALGKWDEVDPRTDIWAVGASLFTLLTGRYVHNGRTANEQLMKSATDQAPKLASVDPYAPRQLGELVDRSLAFKREARFADANAFRQALLACRNALEESTRTGTGPRSQTHAKPVDAPASRTASPHAFARTMTVEEAHTDEERPSGILPISADGTPDERVAIVSLMRDRLLNEARTIESKREALLDELADAREKRKTLDSARKANRAAPRTATTARALPQEIERGRSELASDVAHPAWNEVEPLGQVWESAARDVRAYELAQTSYDHAKFRLGWVLVAVMGLAAVGFVSLLAAKPAPAPDTLELQEKH